MKTLKIFLLVSFFVIFLCRCGSDDRFYRPGVLQNLSVQGIVKQGSKLLNVVLISYSRAIHIACNAGKSSKQLIINDSLRFL